MNNHAADLSLRRWSAWIGLLPLLAQAGHGPEPGMDARFFMQDNNEVIREQFETMRERQLLREGEVHRSMPLAPALAPGVCLPVQALRIAGVTLLTREAVTALAPKEQGCLDRTRLNRLMHELTRMYVQRGYLAARVVPEMAAGVMTLRVIEGRVDRVVGARPGAEWLLPDVVGRPLNIRDLEQGLDQANRLRSVQMRAEILPGQTPGTSTVHLIETRSAPLQGALSLDNRGYDATGRTVVGGSLAYDNPTGHFDFVSLSLEHSLGHARYSRRGALFYALPRGYWTLSLFGSKSEYLNTQRLVYNTVELTGRSDQLGARLDRVVGRSQNAISSAHLQLTHKRVRNYFLDSLQRISSPTLTVVEAGFERSSLHAGGGLSVEAALEQGMPWLGADRDHQAPVEGWPRAQFLKAHLSVSLSQHLRPGAAVPLVLESRLYAQASGDRLPAIEQLELADSNMVRGFRHHSLSGAVGWALRNTLSTRRQLGKTSVSPRLALDVGRVLQHGSPRGQASLAGGGAGLAVSAGRLSLDLEYSRPLLQPAEFAPEPHQLLARLAWQL